MALGAEPDLRYFSAALRFEQLFVFLPDERARYAVADEVADEEVFGPPAEVRQQRRALAGRAAEHDGPFFAFFAHGAEDSAHVALHVFRHSHAVAPLRRIAHAVDGAQLFVEIYAADRAAAREYHVRYRRKCPARGRAHEHLLRFMYRGEAARLALRFQLFGMF